MEFPKTVLSPELFFALQIDKQFPHKHNNDNCQNFHNLSLHFDSTQFDLFTIKLLANFT